MQRDAGHPDEYAQLIRQAREFSENLAREGVDVSIDANSSPTDQYARLQHAVLEQLARCREQAETSRQTEEALQRSRTLLAEAEKLSHTGAWEWDIVRNQWIFSDEWLAIHGTTSRTLTRAELLAITYPEDRPVVRQAFDDVSRGISPYDIEHRIVRQDTGEVRIVRAQGRFVRDANGTVVRVYGFVQDITEQRHAEGALSESERRYRELFETMQESLFVVEVITDEHDRPVDWRYVETNPQVEHYMAMTRDQLVGCTYSEVVPHPDPAWVELLGTVALTREPVSREMYSPSRGRWLHVNAYSPRPRQAAVLFTDITDRKQAVEALRRSEQLTKEAEQALRIIFNSTYDAILLHEPDGTIADVNETFLRLYGVVNLEQSRQLSIADISSPSAPMDTLPALWARVLAGEEMLFEWKARSVSDGHEFDVEVFLRPIVLHERQMLLANVRDITERKQAEAALRQFTATLEQRVHERTAALEATNKELEAFSYSVSHDLRAPLRGIDGFSKLLQERYETQVDATGQDYLRRIRAAAQRMGRLIDDMLRLSRIGRAEMRQAPVNLSELADAVITELRQRDPERQVQVEIAPGLSVTGDAGLLRILLENLLGNAWKFTGKTANARIEFGAREREGERIFYVRDNGAGFDMSYADKLFTPFQRLHSEEEFPGTGIGLALVQRIVARHDGRVWAEGKEGEGATIYFTLGANDGE